MDGKGPLTPRFQALLHERQSAVARERAENGEGWPNEGVHVVRATKSVGRPFSRRSRPTTSTSRKRP